MQPVKKSFIAVILLLVLVVAGIVVHELFPAAAEQSPAPMDTEDTQASAVAVAAMENVFRIDYQEGQDAWLQRVCAISTPSGCTLLASSADLLWQRYRQEKTLVTASARPVEKTADTGQEQVWHVAISLSAPLPGSNKTEDSAYIALAKGDEGWKFDRFLMQPEIDALLSRQTPVPTGEGSKP